MTNTSHDEVAAAIRQAQSVVVVTHAKPDGDAVGSTLAIARSIRHAGKHAEIWFIDPLILHRVDDRCTHDAITRVCSRFLEPNLTSQCHIAVQHRDSNAQPWITNPAKANDRPLQLDHSLDVETVVPPAAIIACRWIANAEAAVSVRR